VRDRAQGRQHTVAQVSVSVDLPARFKGTHMSRFLEALTHWSGELDYASFKKLLADIRSRLQACRSRVRFRFPYFLDQQAPVSKSSSRMDFPCFVLGDMDGEEFSLTLGVEVPVMTVCPCSLAISDTGAHSQRAVVRIEARCEGFLWLEELIRIGQESGSSPVYALLKRADEKFVTESAFERPQFVEDVVRNVAQKLLDHDLVTWFRVEVESFESIHNHSAFACIERLKRGEPPQGR
jgi:GTP cyclohydrolase IB